MMRKSLSAVMMGLVCAGGMGAGVTYNVPAVEGDATEVLQRVVEMASERGDAVINLAEGAEYHVYRQSAVQKAA